MLLNRNPVVRVVNQYLVQVNTFRIIKVILIAVIWITILTRGSLVLAQVTRDFEFTIAVAQECTITANTNGSLQVSFSGGDTTSLVADFNRGTLAKVRLTCNNLEGTYAIITSPEFVVAGSTSNINNDISTGITTLYRGKPSVDVNDYVANDPITPLVSVVGSGTQGTAVRSTPVLLQAGNDGDDLAFEPNWFLIGMEVLFNRQILPAGNYTFKTSLTLLPK
ncbi:hypothetical protein [Anabaenopsis elenkinii]|jgi:hypothetical protein|uniref:Uncharacterized protein n=1 Tax=Anabaenopsis elenkinii CCIBt3563 TaxID=2779889 RepID=A0A7S6RG99_9CYAN|nr:hypothetical protein [Anabaenopsis elenkinii]QOV23882.1 hypothetical protein IM676_06265 [Anabaenopsis elenkinii CCIBt3563]